MGRIHWQGRWSGWCGVDPWGLLMDFCVRLSRPSLAALTTTWADELRPLGPEDREGCYCGLVYLGPRPPGCIPRPLRGEERKKRHSGTLSGCGVIWLLQIRGYRCARPPANGWHP